MTLSRAVLVALALSAGLPLACKDNATGTDGGTTATPSSSTKTTVASASASALGSASAAPSASGSTAAASPSSSADHHRRGPRMGGPSSQFLKGARSLTLKDPQKTKLDEIQKGLEGDHGKPPEEMKTLQADLIAGVKAGKLDTAKIDAHYAAIEKAMQAHLTKEAEGLNALHAVLEPAQRTALVADLRAKMAKRLEHMGKDKDAHGPGDAGAANHTKRMLEHLTQDLGLDADQQKKVEAILPKQDPKAGGDKMAEMKKHHEALLAAFEKDTFDAKKLDGFDVKKAHGPITHESQFIGQLLAILKPEQREKLAARLEKGGMGPHDGLHAGGGGGGHHGKPDDDGDDD